MFQPVAFGKCFSVWREGTCVTISKCLDDFRQRVPHNVNILDRYINLLCKFIVLHDFCSCTKCDLGGCIDEGARVDDQIACGRGYHSFRMCGREDCCEEFLVLNRTGLFDSN
jgi:hypothetical protein